MHSQIQRKAGAFMTPGRCDAGVAVHIVANKSFQIYKLLVVSVSKARNFGQFPKSSLVVLSNFVCYKNCARILLFCPKSRIFARYFSDLRRVAATIHRPSVSRGSKGRLSGDLPALAHQIPERRVVRRSGSARCAKRRYASRSSSGRGLSLNRTFATTLP